MKFPPGQLSPGLFPRCNYPWIIPTWATALQTTTPSRTLSRTVTPWTFSPIQFTITSEKFRPGQLPRRQLPPMAPHPKDNYPQGFCPPDNYLWIICPWNTSPHRHNYPPPLYEIFPGIIISRRAVPSRQFPTMKFLLGQLPPDIHLHLNNSPWLTNPRQLLLFIKFPPWKTNEKCFELSHFEFKLHFIETSIATGDPSTGGIANSILTPWQFCTLFKILFGTHF